MNRSVLAMSIAIVFAPALYAQPVQWSGSGHWYELVVLTGMDPSHGVDWSSARAAALSRTHLGQTGYLVTIATAAENAFLAAAFGRDGPFSGAWTGGREPGSTGHWFWADGPEAGVEYWDNPLHASPSGYANWGGIEPNNLGAQEDYMALYLGPSFAGFGRGAWFDSPLFPPLASDPIIGCIVEYPGTIACSLADIAAVGGTAESPGAPDGQLTVDDIIVFVNLFSDSTGCPGGALCSAADVTGVGGPPEPPDGQLTVDDIIGFINAFSDGCWVQCFTPRRPRTRRTARRCAPCSRSGRSGNGCIFPP